MRIKNSELKIKNSKLNIIALALLFSTSACFTGVESTPRINADEVRRQRASGTAAEALFLSDIAPQAPATWAAGKPFLVMNDRISLIFTPASDNTDGLKGHTIYFDRFTPAMSLMGDDTSEAVFTADDGRRLYYRIAGLSAARLDTLSVLPVPFTVDPALVARADSAMRGGHYFVRTPMWYKPDTRTSTEGLRHVEVLVDSVVPGDENFPAAVYFTVADPALRAKACPDGRNRMVLMSFGTSRSATRNFDVLFSFTDPRKQYPAISDDVWKYIIASKVRAGMTRDECRLALGAPPSLERIPTTAGMAERWRYSDGVYLLFEDGFLTRFRL